MGKNHCIPVLEHCESDPVRYQPCLRDLTSTTVGEGSIAQNPRPDELCKSTGDSLQVIPSQSITDVSANFVSAQKDGDSRAFGVNRGPVNSLPQNGTRNRPTELHRIGFFLVVFLVSALAGRASAAVHPVPLDKNTDSSKCLECHEDKTKGKAVHSAIAMGCTTCHEIRVNKDVTRVKLITATP